MKARKTIVGLVMFCVLGMVVGFGGSARADVQSRDESSEVAVQDGTANECEHQCASINMQCLNRCMAMPFYSQTCFIACEKTRDLCYSNC